MAFLVVRRTRDTGFMLDVVVIVMIAVNALRMFRVVNLWLYE